MTNISLQSDHLDPAPAAPWDYIYYWQLWHRNWDHADVALIKELCPLAGNDVLEVGCGDGRITFQLAPHCRRIIGVDMEPRFIENALKEQQRSGLSNIKFREMDAHALDIPDASVDVVLYPWVLQMVSDPAQAVREAHRVLKPGGKIVVIGLRSNADYDKVIEVFVKDVPAIDPLRCYEQPILNAFGRFDQAIEPECGRLFSYFFKSRSLAYDAFLFALDYWYKTKISESEKKQLRSVVDVYAVDDAVRLRFPASIYTATK